jgi:hypothetical protein
MHVLLVPATRVREVSISRPAGRPAINPASSHASSRTRDGYPLPVPGSMNVSPAETIRGLEQILWTPLNRFEFVSCIIFFGEDRQGSTCRASSTRLYEYPIYGRLGSNVAPPRLLSHPVSLTTHNTSLFAPCHGESMHPPSLTFTTNFLSSVRWFRSIKFTNYWSYQFSD